MSEDIEAISAAACMDVIARGEETINPKFAGVVRDLIDRLRLEASSSQARLSEAVKVLEEATQALEPFAEAEDGYPHFREDNEYADQHEFQIRDLRLAKGSLSRAKAFLATLGEER